MITRNIDVAGGVVNGTIGTVENIQPNLITVRCLKDNELICTTRIKHYVSLRLSTDIAIREQFPLILGRAIIVHGVQGMTISSNVFVLDSTFFALGQAYGALSRVEYSARIQLFFDPDNAIIVSNNVRSLYGLQPLMPSNSVCVEPTTSCIHPSLVAVLSQIWMLWSVRTLHPLIC